MNTLALTNAYINLQARTSEDFLISAQNMLYHHHHRLCHKENIVFQIHLNVYLPQVHKMIIFNLKKCHQARTCHQRHKRFPCNGFYNLL